MTKAPNDGGDNARVRDAVDLLLLRELAGAGHLVEIRKACEETFRLRGEHAWPPVINLPARWSGPYEVLAREARIDEVALDAAERALRDFLDAIVKTGPS